MPFTRKGEMENHWKIEARGGRKTTLGQSRRKVAFIQGSFHPLPDCSEEKGNKFQDTDNSEVNYICFELRKDHVLCFIIHVLTHEDVYTSSFTLRLSAPEG